MRQNLLWRIAVREYFTEMVPDNIRRLGSIYALPKTLPFVVVHDRACLDVECNETLSERLDVVVGALDEGLPRDIVDHGFLWWAVPR